MTPITAIGSSASRYPHLAAVADHLAADMREQFHDGLTLILSALAI